MSQPSLPVLLKRIAMTQMALADHLSHPRLVCEAKTLALFEESKSIVADLQTFTDNYVINVSPRNKVG